MKRTTFIVVSSALLASAAIGAHADVTVTQQDRRVTGWVWISGCESETQNVIAPDPGPFKATVEVDHTCNAGVAAATASQNSQLTADGFFAVGSGHLEAGATQNTVIHDSARTRFNVTFQVDEPMLFDLSGTIAASRSSSIPGHITYTTLRLTGPSGDLYNVTLQPAASQSLSQDVALKGELEPGTYTILAHGESFTDYSFDNLFIQGDVSFNIALALEEIGTPVPGDVTGDGVVNVADLLAVINAWGPCPSGSGCWPNGTCTADLNCDGVVNVSDLLGVIQNWS